MFPVYTWSSCSCWALASQSCSMVSMADMTAFTRSWFDSRSFWMLALTSNRMIKRRVTGTECSWEELKKYNDHRGVAGTECSWDELQEQNDHETSCRNRMIMRRVAGPECSWVELQKQNDQGGVAGTGPSECSSWPATESSRDELKEQNAHGKSNRSRMTTGELQEQKAHGKSNRNRNLFFARILKDTDEKSRIRSRIRIRIWIRNPRYWSKWSVSVSKWHGSGTLVLARA